LNESAHDNIQRRLSHYQPLADSLAGRMVLVTGANRGIGRAVALACCSSGATVLMLGRDVDGLERVAAEMSACGGAEPAIIPLDLEGAGVDDYAHVAELIETRYGRADGLVLNAGVLGELAPIVSYDPLTWARVFQVNVHSQFLLVRAMLPLLDRADDASIIFTSSGVGRRGRAYWGAYAASKFAVEGLAQVLADELRNESRTRVNVLNPGPVRTAMRAQAYPGEDPNVLVAAQDVTGCYVFLLSAASIDVSGRSLDAQAKSG
jgi:NAD(P)-dependent dehydrogenase (short-subunit alcohol dehydrogenase family)